MEGVPKFEGNKSVEPSGLVENEGVYETRVENYETLKVRAEAEVATEFERRTAGYEVHEASGKLAELQEMLTVYAAVVPGTNEPVDNTLRYHAVATQERILSLEATLATPSYNELTTAPGYIKKVNPAAYQGLPANDNRQTVSLAA